MLEYTSSDFAIGQFAKQTKTKPCHPMVLHLPIFEGAAGSGTCWNLSCCTYQQKWPLQKLDLPTHQVKAPLHSRKSAWANAYKNSCKKLLIPCIGWNAPQNATWINDPTQLWLSGHPRNNWGAFVHILRTPEIQLKTPEDWACGATHWHSGSSCSQLLTRKLTSHLEKAWARQHWHASLSNVNNKQKALLQSLGSPHPKHRHLSPAANETKQHFMHQGKMPYGELYMEGSQHCLWWTM